VLDGREIVGIHAESANGVVFNDKCPRSLARSLKATDDRSESTVQFPGELVWRDRITAT